jgi:hypothetical protein
MWTLVVAWFTSIGALGVLPTAACVLWPRFVSHGMLWLFLYAVLIVTAVWLVVIGVCVKQATPVPFDDVAVITILLTTFFGTLALAALAARGFGYRLILGKSSRQPRAISSALADPPAA